MAHQLFIIFHLIAAVVAVGAVTINAVLFLRTHRLKQRNPALFEESHRDLLPTISTAIWLSLIVLSITGILLFQEDPLKFTLSSKFHLKMILVVIVFLNGIITSLLLPHHLKGEHLEAHAMRFHRLIFLSGILSFVTWYSVLLISLVKKFPYSAPVGLLFYLGLLLIPGAISYFMFRRRFTDTPPAPPVTM